MRRAILLVIFGLCSLWSGAQVDDIILFHNFTNEDGLSQSTIRGFAQDEKGFMWIATAEGLHRYDGYSFKVFKHDTRDSNSITDNNLTAINIDMEGLIWLGTDGGNLDVFNSEDLTFKHISIPGLKSNVKGYSITTIFHHPNGYSLVGLDGGGMVKIDRKTMRSKRFLREETDLPNNYINCFVERRNGDGIYVGTQQGLAIFYPEKESFDVLEELALFANQNITGIFQGITRNYFTTRGQGLQIWDTETNEIVQMPGPKIRGVKFQTFIFMDRDGFLWIGTDGGGVMKFSGDEFVTYRNEPYIPTSLIGDNVDCGYMDREGNLWFGLRNGISRYDKSLKVFNLVRDFQHDNTPTNHNVYCIYEDRQENIWLGTLSGGLSRFNKKTRELKVFPIIKTKDVETKAVRSIYQDRKGKLWIGTRDEGLFSFDPETEEFTHYPSDQKIKYNSIRHILEDQEGNLWLATHWGLTLFDRNTGTFSAFRSEYLDNNPIYQIYEDVKRNELILVTFRSGLHIYHKDNNAFTVISHSRDSSSPSVNALMCIESIGNDSFLIGSYGGGLIFFDRKALTFNSITTEDGLPNNVIYGLLRNGSDEYWVSTNHGLSRVNLRTMKFKNFNLSHYLQGLEFNEGAYCKARDGTFYFGGQNGFNFFDPNNLGLNLKPPPVVLTAFRIMDKEVSFDKNILFVNEIEVSYRENLISFEYSALNFTNSSENQYAYMMEGYDNDWIYAGKRRSAYYTKLAPGTYTFRVKASNNNGIWNEEGTSVKVIIKPPYYLTWWFIALVSTVAVLLVILLFRFRTKNIARRYEHKLTDMELRALRSQMNPHFIFNSLNSIQYFVLNKEPEDAYNYLAKFSSLMRMILQNSGLKYISLQSEKDWLQTYLELEKMRMDNEFEFSINIEDSINPDQIQIPSMMVQPYVENAIIHGLMHKEGERRLSVDFKKTGNALVCIVEDNGIGRQESIKINLKKSVKHKSHGMKLTKDRLEIISRDKKQKPDLQIKDLYDADGNATGTRVVITIPLIYEE